MTVIYSKPLFRRFYASRFSAAYLLFLVVALVVIILPFFMAYSASGPNFWSKHKTYLEQPQVAYEYKYIMFLEGTKARGSAPMGLFFSSMARLNSVFSSQMRVPVLRSAEVDEDYDGVYDRLDLTAEMPLLAGEAIYSAKMFIFFQLKLSKWAKLVTHTMGYASYASPLAGSALYIDGDLDFKQTWPLPVRGGFHSPYNVIIDDTTLLPWTDGNQSMQNFFPNLLKKYRLRNYTTNIDDSYAMWTGFSPAAADPNDLAGTTFNFTATIRYPQAEVMYTPAVSEVLFDAWVRYLALLVVVMYLLDAFLYFVYYHQLVHTHQYSEGQPTGSLNRFKPHLQ
jgi:transmembrane protein 231